MPVFNLNLLAPILDAFFGQYDLFSDNKKTMNLQLNQKTTAQSKTSLTSIEMLRLTACDWGVTPLELNHRAKPFLFLRSKHQHLKANAEKREQVMRPNLAAVDDDMHTNCLA